jgi:signal transduction histidine kinase
MLSSGFRAFAVEPAIPDPPQRVWRDWVLVAVGAITAVLEAALRSDAAFDDVAPGWRVATVVVWMATMPFALLNRRTRPLLSTVVAFVPTLLFGAVTRLVHGEPTASLNVSAVVVIVAYALYRWGSGRDGVRGAAVLVGALIVGNLTDAGSVGDVIGGSFALAVPVLLGLSIRFGRSARARALSEAQAGERAAIARELHDTVAHHVSAIAIQAQAGQAIAAGDPGRAIAVLPIIEEAAARTLEEMRSIVGRLRAGDAAELAPLHGIVDVAQLSSGPSDHPGSTIEVVVTVDPSIVDVSPITGAAVYRIAQESVTNARRHARGATRADVRVTPTATGLRVSVTDDGARTAAPTGQGFGLTGMAERARLLGGTFSAGPSSDGGWQVVADLPRQDRR